LTRTKPEKSTPAAATISNLRMSDLPQKYQN
jgi:hypothetical protein